MSDWLTILLILTPVLGMFSGLLYVLRRRVRYVSTRPAASSPAPRPARPTAAQTSDDSDALEVASDVLQVVGVALEVASVFSGEGGGFGGGGASGNW